MPEEIRKCKYCGKEFTKINTSEYPKDYCSYICYENWRKFNDPPNCKCAVCGKDLYIKPSHLSSRKHKEVTCSKKCSNKLRETTYLGANNHQFGLKGNLNASFKGPIIDHKNHSLTEVMVYVPNHPKANRNGRVTIHRYTVEQNWEKFDSKFFEEINGIRILKSGYVVHHKDCNHSNNNIENLEVLTKSEHMKKHSDIIKNKTTKYDRIIGVLKQEKLLEKMNSDQQAKASTTNDSLLQQILNIIGDDIV